MSGWGCPYFYNENCNKLQVKCEPGQKGCVLYGFAVFSDPNSPSNEAIKRREKKDEIKKQNFN